MLAGVTSQDSNSYQTTKYNSMSASKQPSRSNVLVDYNVIVRQINDVKKSHPTMANELTKILKDVKAFTDNYKITCAYRLAVSNKGDNANGGIEVGKVRMPATLAKFLLDKATVDDKATKPTMNALFAMLLKHRKFNVVIAHKMARIKFPQNAKLD